MNGSVRCPGGRAPPPSHLRGAERVGPTELSGLLAAEASMAKDGAVFGAPRGTARVSADPSAGGRGGLGAHGSPHTWSFTSPLVAGRQPRYSAPAERSHGESGESNLG